jgi:hypothetical protein
VYISLLKYSSKYLYIYKERRNGSCYNFGCAFKT